MRSATLLLMAAMAGTAFSQSDVEALIQRGIQAQSNGGQITDLVLSGTVTCTKNGTSESGNITLAINNRGQSSVTVNTPSENYTDLGAVVTDSSSSAANSTATNLNVQGQASHSPLASNPTWFSPYFSLVDELQMTTHARSDKGSSSDSGRQLRHIEIVNKPGLRMTDVLNQRPNQLAETIEFDDQTGLPSSMVFHAPGVHKAGSVDSPWVNHHPSFEEKVLYSDYQQISGLAIPMHIQVLIQRRPYLDIYVAKASVNTGASVPPVVQTY